MAVNGIINFNNQIKKGVIELKDGKCKNCENCGCGKKVGKEKLEVVKEDGRKPVILPKYKAEAIRRYAAKDVFAVSGD